MPEEKRDKGERESIPALFVVGKQYATSTQSTTPKPLVIRAFDDIAAARVWLKSELPR